MERTTDILVIGGGAAGLLAAAASAESGFDVVLAESTDLFLKFGNIDIDHKSMPAVAKMHGIERCGLAPWLGLSYSGPEPREGRLIEQAFVAAQGLPGLFIARQFASARAVVSQSARQCSARIAFVEVQTSTGSAQATARLTHRGKQLLGPDPRAFVETFRNTFWRATAVQLTDGRTCAE